MPNVNPNSRTIVPGIATGNTYPQWSIGGGTPGTSSGWKIVEAMSEAQKNSYISQGYDVWFSSKSAAQSFLSSEENPYLSGEPQNAIPGLAQIGQFFSDLTQRNTWLRIAKIAAGFVLVIVGVAHLVHAGNIVTAAAKVVPL